MQAVERNDFTADVSTPVKTVCEVWAAMHQMTGWERVNADQTHAGSNAKAYVRPPSVEINSTMQLVVDDVTYEIAGVVETSDRELELTLIGPDRAGGARNLR